MPYILVRSYLNSGFGGPTFIDYHAKVGEQGEFESLRSAMSHLLAYCTRRGCCDYSEVSLANNHNAPYCSYQINEPPYLVLNSLEKHGYKVVAANSAADAVQNVLQIWTLHKQA